MTDLLNIVDLSQIGLGGIVTLFVLGIVFGKGVMPTKFHNEVVKRNKVLEKRIEVRDKIITTQAETINELARELTPTVNQILKGLPIIPHKDEGE